MKNAARLKEQVLAVGSAAGTAAKSTSRAAALIRGMIAALAVLLAGSLILAAAYVFTDLSSATAHLLQLVLLGLTALFGGFITAKRAGSQGLISGLILAAGLLIMMLLWNISLGTGIALDLTLFVKVLILALFGALGGMFGVF